MSTEIDKALPMGITDSLRYQRSEQVGGGGQAGTFILGPAKNIKLTEREFNTVQA